LEDVLNNNSKSAPDGEKKTPPNQAVARRSEKAGVFHFTKDMISALAMALVAIVYVIQAFKIPTGSMENSLLVGDFLLGIKFMYGAPVLPFTYYKFPGVTNPKPGDVIIFKYPGTDKKDYIKRCVAGPGQTVTINDTSFFIDGKKLLLPPKGQFIRNGQLDPPIRQFASLRVPKKGDTLHLSPDMLAREFVFSKHLIHQEHPTDKVTVKVQLYLDGEYSNHLKVLSNGFQSLSFDEINFNDIDNWLIIDNILTRLPQGFPGKTVEIKKLIFLNDKIQKDYVVKFDNYFMMGDNRDNSTDSRYWGFLNRNFIKAKAFILYFSLDSETPWWQLPFKIRWNRIGKLIRSWDGISKN
jgi:signal peptidase I